MTRIRVIHQEARPADCTCSWVGLDIWAVSWDCPSDHNSVEPKVESI